VSNRTTIDQFSASFYSWLQQCLLHRAPQDDPQSYPMMMLGLAAYAVMDLLQARASSSWQLSLAMTAADTLLVVLFARVVLMVARKPERYVQTLTALAGTGAIVGLVGLPLVQMAERSRQLEQPVGGGLLLAWLLLVGWSVTVQAHIFRHALSTGIGIGLLVAGLHLVLAIGLFRLAFPVTAG
jgi:hypothetical protein